MIYFEVSSEKPLTSNCFHPSSSLVYDSLNDLSITAKEKGISLNKFKRILDGT